MKSVLLLAAVGMPLVRGQDTRSVAVVTLRPAVMTRDTVVPIGAVAGLSGGTSQLRQRIAGLDLADLSAGEKKLVISKEQVAFRIQIAGIDPRLFRVDGSQTLISMAPQDVTEESLLVAASQAVRQHLPENAAQASVQLARPVQLPPFNIQPQDQVRLAAELPTGQTSLGQVRVPVAIYLNGQRHTTVPVYLDVSCVQPAAAVVAEPQPKKAPVLVKARDSVRLVASIGAVRVTALGEALQDGRAGDSIRVRNVDSSKIITGRVVDAQTVEVDY